VNRPVFTARLHWKPRPADGHQQRHGLCSPSAADDAQRILEKKYSENIILKIILYFIFPK